MGRLNDILNDYEEKNPIRFHMPGNKGKIKLLGSPLNFDIPSDVTELFFTDNLYNPDASCRIIYEIEENIASCFFPAKDYINSVISCGGATLCIQTAILSLLRSVSNFGINKKNFLICDRLSHISLINTLALSDVSPLWIYPKDFENSYNFDKCIENFVKTHENEVIGVFLTSPNYYGKTKNINVISEICKKYSLSLIVDNSHGSHLAFHGDGELHPINAGADMSIDSIHKTLPVLTGAAVLHANKKFDKEILLRPSMRVFASTSPSFPILKSIDAAVDWLAEHGREEHKILLGNINSFRRKFENIGFISSSDCSSSDPYRIVLNAELSENIGNTGACGKILYNYLCSENIVCEFYDSNSVILIPSVFNSGNDFSALSDALNIFANNFTSFCRTSKADAAVANLYELSVNPVVSMSLSQALRLPRKKISVCNAAGKISAEYITVYPPGIPVVLPGELIDENNINIIKRIREYIDVL